MNRKVAVVFVLGILSLCLVTIAPINIEFIYVSKIISFFGVFIGTWLVGSLITKSILLNKKDTAYLFIGMSFSIASLWIGGYGSLLIFIIPSTILGKMRVDKRSAVLRKMKPYSGILGQLQNKVEELEKSRDEQR